MNIKKLEEIKTALSKILEIEKVEFSSMTSEAGQILEWENDSPMPEVGDVLYIGGEERTVAPAGEYTVLNEVGQTTVITVGEEGKVLSVEVASENEPDEPEVIDEEEVKAEEDEQKEEVVVIEEVIDPDQTDEQNMEDLIKELADAKAEIEALKAENEELKAKIAELEAEPQVKPVEQQFEAMVKKQKSSGALKYVQALKK